MTNSIDSSELRKLSLDFDRKFVIRKWLSQSSHMTAARPSISQNSTEAHCLSLEAPTLDVHKKSIALKYNRKSNDDNSNKNAKYSYNKLFVLLSNNGHTATPNSHRAAQKKLNFLASKTDFALKRYVSVRGHYIDGQKPKLRSLNSHDTSPNMFSVADFENARLVRRNEIEMKKRIFRRMHSGCNSFSGAHINKIRSRGNFTADVSSNALNKCSADCSTVDSMMSSKIFNSQQKPLPADLFFERYSTPSYVHISYKMKSNEETLQSFSSNGSAVTTHSSASVEGNVDVQGFHTTPTGNCNSDEINTSASSSESSNTKSCNPATRKFPNESKDSSQKFYRKQGDLFLLYKFINQRRIYHGQYAIKTAILNRKKVLIPQEFPGYFSLMDDNGLPRATQYNSLMQIVRERISKFISVDPIPAYVESQANQKQEKPEECFQNFAKTTPNRVQYYKTTARGGEVYRLIAVFEDGNCATNATSNINVNIHKLVDHHREKEKCRYAQLMNDARQVFYASLSIKGKFYEVEPGVPFIFQSTSANDMEKKINPVCVYRITDLVTPQTILPVSLGYISGPNTNAMPENVSIAKISKENVVIVCPIDGTENQYSFHLKKLNLTKEMNFLRSNLGFDTDKNMWADPNVQCMVKYCQINCDSFLQMVEKLPEHPSSKQQCVRAKLLKPLHLTKLLRREKTTTSADEKEGSIIFLTKTDLNNLEAKENSSGTRMSTTIERSIVENGVYEKMKVFQPSKNKWFQRDEKLSFNSIVSLDAQMKIMSMERYKDVSKLLQDRFGEKSNWISKGSTNQKSYSERSCSDIEKTTFTEIKTKLNRLEQAASLNKNPGLNCNALIKSLSLQDIEYQFQKAKPDTSYASDQFSEVELSTQRPTQITSFITEKLYNEFHEKSRKFSKSSSSLQKLLNFSQPQKMQLSDHKRILAELRDDFRKNLIESTKANLITPMTPRNTAFDQTDLNKIKTTVSNYTPNLAYFIEDELLYSTVRDSLVLTSDDVNVKVNHTSGSNSEENPAIGDARENIKDETFFEAIFHSDDFGDYASLYNPEMDWSHNQQSVQAAVVQSFNCDQIEIKPNSECFHSIFLNAESKFHPHSESCGCESCYSHDSTNQQQSYDRSHITSVKLLGTSYSHKISKTGDEKECLDIIQKELE